MMLYVSLLPYRSIKLILDATIDLFTSILEGNLIMFAAHSAVEKIFGISSFCVVTASGMTSLICCAMNPYTFSVPRAESM